MRNIGFLLLLIGASHYVFPLINMRSRILGLFGEQQQIAAIAALAVGAVLLGLSFRGKKTEEKK